MPAEAPSSGPSTADLVEFLRLADVDEDDIAAAVDAGGQEVRRLAYAVTLLGGAPELTPRALWSDRPERETLARELWRSMGFAELPEDAVALTEADRVALDRITRYMAESGTPVDRVLRFTRLLGQNMSRVADALLSIVDEGVDELEALVDGDADNVAVVAAGVVLPMIEAELVYLLRRHLYDGALRRLGQDTAAAVDTVVGFADVVSFTRLSGQLSEAGLVDLLEEFERVTAEEIAEHGGRVVKLIGDAVMFTFDEPVDAVDCALHLVERFGGDHPDLRVGLARGPVVSRQGDIFGATVNLASRLVAFARPGTVLCDNAVADALAEAPGGRPDHAGADTHLRMKALRPRELKGLGTTPMFVVRRG